MAASRIIASFTIAYPLLEATRITGHASSAIGRQNPPRCHSESDRVVDREGCRRLRPDQDVIALLRTQPFFRTRAFNRTRSAFSRSYCFVTSRINATTHSTVPSGPFRSWIENSIEICRPSL